MEEKMKELQELIQKDIDNESFVDGTDWTIKKKIIILDALDCYLN